MSTASRHPTSWVEVFSKLPLTASRSSCVGLLVFLLLALTLLQACANSSTVGSDLLDQKLESKPAAIDPSSKRARLDRFIASQNNDDGETFSGVTRSGNDRLTGPPISQTSPYVDDESEKVTLNLVDATIPQAAKTVLGNVLEINYSIDSRVTGTVTLQTSKPISRRSLLAMFEDALLGNGAAIVEGTGGYRIVPLAEAQKTIAPVETSLNDTDRPGKRPQLVPLRFVSAEDMRDVLGPLIPEGMLVNIDAKRNALILSGTAREIASIKETISVFDVDWMKGMSFALVRLRSSSPDAVVQDLESIFETKKGPLKGILRFVPNRRLKSVLVISSRAKYLKEASKWIDKIDVLAESGEQSLHVYRVQNRTASDLAKVLQSVLQTNQAGKVAVESVVAPKLQSTETNLPAVGDPIVGPETPPGGFDSSPEEDSVASTDAGGGQPGIRVVADDANNSLLIFCAAADYERILGVLEEIDAIPNQVLLEAVIAEVSLDDELKFGVRWFFGDDGSKGTLSDLESGVVAAAFPGFSYLLKANDIAFSLRALSSVTDVRVLSSPSLVVLDNKTAVLQVGDQVPIVTQTARGTDIVGAPIVNNVELKDTGVILSVTPRVNDSGRVILDIQQEVSSVVRTTTSGIDSPTIQQRKVKTSVVVTDGEALALGGLIQERETTGKSKVPILGDVPLLGTAFRQKSNRMARTELIIFIRPRVIRDLEEARRVTQEFRRQLGIQAPRVRRGEPRPADEFDRIIN